MVDLKNGFCGVRDEEEERERLQRAEIWVGILTLFGWEEKREEILVGRTKWVGRIVERESEIEAVGAMASWFWSSD